MKKEDNRMEKMEGIIEVHNLRCYGARRSMDALGRVVIPFEFLRTFPEKISSFDIFLTDEGILFCPIMDECEQM